MSEDYSVIYIRIRADSERLRIIEDAMNHVLTTFGPESVLEVYGSSEEFENRYEEEF